MKREKIVTYIAVALNLLLVVFIILRFGFSKTYSFYYPIIAVAILLFAEACIITFIYREISIVALLVMLVGIIFVFAGIYYKVGIVDSSGVTTKDYVTCLYFSIVTFTTLGYGDFRPTDSARLFAAIEALTGYVSMALFVAAIIIKMQYARREIGKTNENNIHKSSKEK